MEKSAVPAAPVRVLLPIPFFFAVPARLAAARPPFRALAPKRRLCYVPRISRFVPQIPRFVPQVLRFVLRIPRFVRPAFCGAQTASALPAPLDLRNQIDTPAVAPALKGGAEPRIHDHFGQFCAHHPCAEGKHIGVVVLFGKHCGIRFAANHGADAVHLIGRKRNAHACAADENAAIGLAALYRKRRAFAVYRVIAALRRIGAAVYDLVSLRLQIRHKLRFQGKGRMVVSKCDLHWQHSFLFLNPVFKTSRVMRGAPFRLFWDSVFRKQNGGASLTFCFLFSPSCPRAFLR